MSGRPIRFLGIATVSWVGVRAFMLWPTMGPAATPRALVPAALAENASRAVPAQPFSDHTTDGATRASLAAYVPVGPLALRASDPVAIAPVAAVVPVTAQSVSVVASTSAPLPPQIVLAPPTAVPARPPTASRWSASAWFVLRDGRGIAPGLGGGQLGGSQAGLRVAYAIDDARRFAIVGRTATPLKGPGREAAIGMEWRPTALPVRVVAEYRVALDGGTSGPAVGVIAGTGPAPLALGLDLETYGQAGIVRRRRTEPFAEGAARLSRPVVTLGKAKIDLGLGGWGGAQRGVQRLDVGPSLGVRIPVAGRAIRAALDWRQRIAGNARPGSGPVLVVGSDF